MRSKKKNNSIRYDFMTQTIDNRKKITTITIEV